MCTVTYLPGGESSYIITSNRDEFAQRPTDEPAMHPLASGIDAIFPKDGLAGGTWICAANSAKATCLLNGAFEKHERKLPYSKSRGIVLLDFFNHEDAIEFHDKYSLWGVEPFTLVIQDNGPLYELRWDGEKKYLNELDSSLPHIWSSASLYSKKFIQKREAWFKQWLEESKDHDIKDIYQLHRYGGDGDSENDFVMNRFGVLKTISITNIIRKSNQFEMIYNDLNNNKTSSSILRL